MTKPRDPDALLSEYLADGMTVLPDRVVESVLGEIHRTRQRTIFGPWRTRPMLRAVLSTAAVVALLVVGGALLTLRGKLDVAAPTTTPEASLNPSQPAVVIATPTPTAEVVSLDLTWTKVDLAAGLGSIAWLGDRFVLVDGAGAISTSIDGASWHVLQPGDPDPGYAKLLQGNFVSSQDDIVAWWNPTDLPGDYPGKPPVTGRDVLRILEPPAALSETTPFKGRIESIGVGPLGIVAQVASDLDWDAWVATKLGANWVSHQTSVSFENGILDIGMDNGPGLHVVWADQGFELGDYQGAGFEWFSPDGKQWTAVPAVDPTTSETGAAFLPGSGDIVGVSDGFIARVATWNDTCPNGCDVMWHSPDGLSWRKLGLGAPSPSDSALLPWMGGALLTDGATRFELWTAQGASQLATAGDVPVPTGHSGGIANVGPFGLVSILPADEQVIFTRDGVDWKVQPIPDAMAAFSGINRHGPSVHVGDRSVLFSSWTEIADQVWVPSLWVGSVEP
jgi:hypothetical protein